MKVRKDETAEMEVLRTGELSGLSELKLLCQIIHLILNDTWKIGSLELGNVLLV